MRSLSIIEIVARALAKNETAVDLVKRKSAQAKRASLKKAWNVSGKSIRHKKKLQRAIEKVVRKDKTYNPKRSGLGAADRVLLLREMRPSTVLDGLYPIRRQRNHWQKLRSRDPATANTEIDLAEFSFLRSPQATLDALKAIAQAESRALGARINFKDEYCLDVAPFMLLVECWKEMMPVFEGGEMN